MRDAVVGWLGLAGNSEAEAKREVRNCVHPTRPGELPRVGSLAACVLILVCRGASVKPGNA